jgi:acyl carrier protein
MRIEYIKPGNFEAPVVWSYATGGRMESELTARVITEIASVKRIPAERISIDSTFEELAIDSLDATSLLFALEEEFGVSIPDAEARSIRNVRDAVTQVERLLAAKDLSQG